MKKGPGKIILVVLIILMIIIGVTIGVLFAFTDVFKTPAQMLMMSTSNTLTDAFKAINEFAKGSSEERIKAEENRLNANSYKEDIDIEISIREDLGTTAENADSILNNTKISMGKTVDLEAEYSEYNVEILEKETLEKENEEEQQESAEETEKTDDTSETSSEYMEILNFSYIEKENDMYIYEENVYDKYIEAEESVIKEQLVPELEILDIYEETDIDTVIEGFEFEYSEDVLNETLEKYASIIMNSLKTQTVEKQPVELANSQNDATTLYSVTYKKEDIVNLAIVLLEVLKEEQLITNNMQYGDTLLEDINEDGSIISEGYKEFITQLIEELKSEAIGDEPYTIETYTTKEGISYFAIKSNELEISINVVGENVSLQLKDLTADVEVIIELEKTANDRKIFYSIAQKNEIISYSLVLNQDIVNEGQYIDTITLEFETDETEIKIELQKEVQIIDEINVVEFTEENTLFLTEKEESVKTQNVEVLKNRINLIREEILNKYSPEFEKIIKEMFLSAGSPLTGIGQPTEIEINRFNAPFELEVGKSVSNNSVLSMLDNLNNNINGYKVISENELLLEIDRDENNQDKIDELKTVFEENTRLQYNISLTYEEETGFVDGVMIEIIEE